jgi:hypothetical protein
VTGKKCALGIGPEAVRVGSSTGGKPDSRGEEQDDQGEYVETAEKD